MDVGRGSSICLFNSIVDTAPLGVGRSTSRIFGTLGTEEVGGNPGVQQLHNGLEFHAARRLVLINGSAQADRVVHQLIEGPALHDLDLQRSNGVV